MRAGRRNSDTHVSSFLAALGCWLPRAHDAAMIDRRSFRGGTVCGLSQRDAAACICFCCVHLVSTSSIGMPFSCRRLAECLLQSAAGLGTWPALSEGCGSRFGALAMRLRRRVYPGCSPFSWPRLCLKRLRLSRQPGASHRGRSRAGGACTLRVLGRAIPLCDACFMARAVCGARGAERRAPLWIWFSPPCWPLNEGTGFFICQYLI